MIFPESLREVISNLRAFATEVSEDDLSGAAAELAYRLFLAIFPFFIFLAALGSFAAQIFNVANPAEEIVDALGDSLPEDSANVLRRQIDSVIESRDAGLLSVGIMGSIWAASSAMGTIMKTMNRVYDVRESRSIWKRYVIAVGLTIMGGTFLLTAMVSLVIGEAYGRDLADAVGMGPTYTEVLYFGRWPATMAVVMLAVAVLYWAAPAVDLPFRLVSRGSVFFAVGWLLASFLFGLYVANFGSYNSTYGTLGGVVIALLWAYITGFLLLAGAEIDALRFQSRNSYSQMESVSPEAIVPDAEQPSTSSTKTTSTNAIALVLVTMGMAGVMRILRRGAKKGAANADNDS